MAEPARGPARRPIRSRPSRPINDRPSSGRPPIGAQVAGSQWRQPHSPSRPSTTGEQLEPSTVIHHRRHPARIHYAPTRWRRSISVTITKAVVEDRYRPHPTHTRPERVDGGLPISTNETARTRRPTGSDAPNWTSSMKPKRSTAANRNATGTEEEVEEEEEEEEEKEKLRIPKKIELCRFFFLCSVSTGILPLRFGSSSFQVLRSYNLEKRVESCELGATGV